MKYFIRILFIIDILLICIGYFFKLNGDHVTGDRWVGIGILSAAFVLMPAFIYHRWKGKNVKDYMLSNENIQKMRDFNDQKKIEKE